jgi:hypothetical protein
MPGDQLRGRCNADAGGRRLSRVVRRYVGRDRRPNQGPSDESKESAMLWALLVLLVAFWALGLIASIGGSAIHLLLVLAAIVLVAQFVMGRRSTN